eukprot:gene14995-21053_t
MRHGSPISDADLDHLCGKVSTLGLCFLHKREVLKVARGDLPIQCIITPTTSAGSYSVPTPLDKDCNDCFLLQLEVDDPDDPVNNPSIFCVIPKAQDDFFDSPGSDGRLECERWMSKLSGDCGYEHVRVSVTVDPACISRHIVLPSNPGRYSRAVCEDKDARLGICFACKYEIGRKKKKKCKGCNRVAYCSSECQLKDWNEHKPEMSSTCTAVALWVQAFARLPATGELVPVISLS